uniref:Putative secreted protein n=1 Tax=Ixodes ricinus TaxID=34613 RepID=A0A6B0TWA5_IXORI
MRLTIASMSCSLLLLFNEHIMGLSQQLKLCLVQLPLLNSRRGVVNVLIPARTFLLFLLILEVCFPSVMNCAQLWTPVMRI